MALATGSGLPTGSAVPLSAVTDQWGFINSPARCAPDQSAVLAGRTPLSLVAICADGRGGYSYHGFRLSDGAVQLLPAASVAGDCFAARSDVVEYTVSTRKLLLISGLRVLRDEPMLEVRDYRAPAAGLMAQQAVNRGS